MENSFKPKILFLGETYRADAQSWIKGIENESGQKIDTMEVLESSSRMGRIFRFLQFGLDLICMNFKTKYDFVLAERATSYGFFSLFVNAKVHIVAQQGITDAFPETGFSGFYKRILQKKVYKHVDLIHAWGEVMVPAMLQSKADLKKIMIMPKGLDLNYYGFKDPFTRNIQAKAIVTRALSDVYHHEVIIEAISILNKADSPVQLTIVGDGPKKDFFFNRVKELQIENLVSFVGRIPNEELPELLQESSIYISVPETEGVSASLFEAMASGCFPIVTELPGTKAFIRDGENGFLIPTNDAVSLAGAIQTFLSSSDKFYPAINQNRRYIESNVKRSTNMKKIYARYLSLLERVN